MLYVVGCRVSSVDIIVYENKNTNNNRIWAEAVCTVACVNVAAQQNVLQNLICV